MKKARDNSKMASSPAQLKNSSDKLLLELIEFAQKSAHDKDFDVFEFRTKANDPDSEVAAPCDHATVFCARCVARPQHFERMRD